MSVVNSTHTVSKIILIIICKLFISICKFKVQLLLPIPIYVLAETMTLKQEMLISIGVINLYGSHF